MDWLTEHYSSEACLESYDKKVFRTIELALKKFEGKKITRLVAIAVAKELTPKLPSAADTFQAFEELVDSVLVRKGMTLTDKVIRERVNNITTGWNYYGT